MIRIFKVTERKTMVGIFEESVNKKLISLENNDGRF